MPTDFKPKAHQHNIVENKHIDLKNKFVKFKHHCLALGKLLIVFTIKKYYLFSLRERLPAISDN